MSRGIWQFIAVFLVAINMRMTITGVGPLLDDIADSRGSSAAELGLLASIPLLTWAVVSPLAHSISARLGVDRAITWSLVFLGAGTALRSLSFAPLNLWLGTIILGAALAVGNVLMPAVVKRDFGKRAPTMMGVYSAALGISGGIGAAIAIPVARTKVAGAPLGWEAGLAASGIAIPFAIVAWVLFSRFVRREAARADAPIHTPLPAVQGLGRRVWSAKTAWLLAFYMGAQSTTFYILATWIVPIELSHGINEGFASAGITLFHVLGMTGSLVAPLLLRFDARRVLQVTLPVAQLISMAGLVFAPSLIIVWLMVLGACCGASLSVSLTLITQRSPDLNTATAVSGMTQAVGYAIAALGPVLFGLAKDLTGGWLLPLGVVAAGLSLQFVTGWILRDGRMVRL